VKGEVLLLVLLSSSLSLSLEGLDAWESSESEDIDCAFRFRGFEVEIVLDVVAFVFDEDGFGAVVFVLEAGFEAVDVEDGLRDVVLDVVLFVVVELFVPSDWRRGALKGKRLRFT
jgi:hypothetical protein